ncbi:hypothetical protein M758_UG119100 [Ceratodon purpureus]|nr:hypothetical protein M758_UG119100 [Ceratodon purpureus]
MEPNMDWQRNSSNAIFTWEIIDRLSTLTKVVSTRIKLAQGVSSSTDIRVVEPLPRTDVHVNHSRRSERLELNFLKNTGVDYQSYLTFLTNMCLGFDDMYSPTPVITFDLSNAQNITHYRVTIVKVSSLSDSQV